jgi:hypothetical protein
VAGWHNLRCLKPKARKVQTTRRTRLPRFAGLPLTSSPKEQETARPLGLQRVPDGVLHGFEGVFRATSFGAATLGDIGLASAAPA